MRSALIAFTLFAATAALAQTKPATVSISSSTTAAECPAEMNVSQHNAGKTLWTISQEDARKSGQLTADSDGTGVHVSLRSKTSAGIKQVSVRVFYPQPGLHYVPVDHNSTVIPTQPQSIRDLKKTFHLSAEGGASLHLAGNLLVGQAAGITRVSLINIEYADGATWHAPTSFSCSVEPDHFLLVNTK